MASSSNLPSTILMLAFLFSLAFVVNAKSKPCSDDFDNLTRQRNISQYCKKLRTLGAEFGWNYEIGSNSTLIEILFGTNLNSPSGWIAWGVNPGKRAEMIGTKAIIGIKHADGTLKADKYDITTQTRNGCGLRPARDIGVQVLNMSMENAAGSKFYTIYARLELPHGEYNVTRLNHVWQVGNAVEGDVPLQHPTTLHNDDSTGTIDLTSGRITGQSRSLLRSVHGVLNIIGWGTFIPTGIIIARYFRVFPIRCDRAPKVWFYAHVICQSTGFLVGASGWIIGLYLGHASRYYTFHTHRIFGIVIFTFSTIQMLAFRLKPRETDDYRKYWNMYHHFLGYGLLAIIVINIFKGINILRGGEGWRWAYIGILALLGAVTFGLEIFTWVQFLRLKLDKNPKDDQKPGLNKPDDQPKK